MPVAGDVLKKLIRKGQIEWPAQSLKEVIDSTELVKKISS